MFKKGRKNASAGLSFLGAQHLGLLFLQSLSFPIPCQPGNEGSSPGRRGCTVGPSGWAARAPGSGEAWMRPHGKVVKGCLAL